jgi:hypothetical protein
MQLAVLGRAGSSGGAALSLSEEITMGMWCRLSRHRPEAVQALRMTVSSLAAFGRGPD